jgi:EF-P beta-lysylation protein EpmB
MNSSNVGSRPEALSTPPNWQESLRDAVRSASELLAILEIHPQDLGWFQPGKGEFPLLVPKTFVARMKPGDPNDPLLRQVLPVTEENIERQEFSADPLGELALVHNGIIKKYPARALIITTAACPIHCRYCFRRHFPYEAQAASRGNWGAALAELRNRKDIREVILSGGDPLTLSNRRLQELVSKLERFPSITALRIHSRFPIILPARVDQGLLEILQETRLKTVLVVHSNHANEIDESVRSAMERVHAAGTLVLNQSVLLRGVNNDVSSLEALSYRLFDASVVPYYLHQLDHVAGAAHFKVGDVTALELVAALRQRVPGYLVPKLVQEIPGELSKTPLRENLL